MIRKVSIAALAVLGCTGANAAADNRIRSMTYDPNQIVRIVAKPGIQSTIEFGPDERIENVAVGDSSAWQITPNHRASLLFLKPLAPRSRTNMTVVTDQRTYMFDLVAGDKWTTPLYALKFSYPNEKRAEESTKAAPPVVAATVAVPPPAIMTADKLHFDWNSTGERKLLPSRVFDDGASVYLAWSRETPLPAILTVAEDRREGPVNYRMSGEYIVVSPVPQNLLLRYGRKMATLWPSRRAIPAPASAPSRVAVAANSPPQNQPVVIQPMPTQAAPAPAATMPAAAASGSVTLADMTSLYSDKLTGGRR